jgi:hypothetical protein
VQGVRFEPFHQWRYHPAKPELPKRRADFSLRNTRNSKQRPVPWHLFQCFTSKLGLVSHSQRLLVFRNQFRKLFSKACLCALITSWNKADELIKKLGLNNCEVARLVCTDARVSKYGASKFGQRYRRKLVPTCMDGLINAFCRDGLNSLLFEGVRTYIFRIGKRHAST